MSKSKSEERREDIQRSDKMVKPSKSVRNFNFPAHNVSVEASSIKEANKKLDTHLKSKSNQDD